MDYIFHICVIAGIYALIAQSANLIVGYAGLAALGQAGFACVGAYTTALLSQQLAISPWVSTLIAIVNGGACGALVAYPVLKLRGDYLALATFGLGIIAYSIAMNWYSLTRGPSGLANIEPYVLLGLAIEGPKRFAILVAAAVLATTLFIRTIVQSPFGRTLKAIRDDEIAAIALGKNIVSYKIKVLVLGGGMAAGAGALYAHYVGFIDPTSFTSTESLTVLLMVVLGGLGTIVGPVVGASVLVAFPEALRFIGVSAAANGPLRQLVYGALLIALMHWRPQGLFGHYRLR